MCRLAFPLLLITTGCGGLAVDAKLIQHADSATTDSAVEEVNQQPEITAVELGAEPVFTNDILTALVSVTPDAASLTYEWHVVDVLNNGSDAVVQTGSGASLDGAVHFERGQQVYVMVQAELSGQESDPAISESITVANTPPMAPVLGINPSPGVAGFDDITCSVVQPSVDVDGDNVKYAYEWYAPNENLVQSEPSSPSLENVLSGGLTAEGGWRCRVVPSDRTDSGEASEISVLLEAPSFAYAFTEHQFSSCSNAGHLGPSLNDCQSAYSSEQWVSDGQYFDVNDGIQEWLIPANGVYRIQVRGAQGGANHCGDAGGLGAEMQGEFSLVQGQWLRIIVGQSGVTSSSGNCANGGGGGGGGTFVWIDGESTPLIVAGGGGGSGLTNNGYPNCIGMDAPVTSDGTQARDGSPGGVNGTDGNNGGGVGWNNIQIKPQGIDGSTNIYNGTGGFGGGGRGGNPMDCNNNQHSPGAGGGYSGGGATVTCYYAGGAGGSYNTGANPVETAGSHSGEGQVSITYLGQ